MKKLLVLFAVMLATPVIHAACFTSNEVTPSVDEMQAVNPVPGDIFVGSIGGDDSCFLMMPNGSETGYYTFLNYTRDIRFGSYNTKTRTLVINAYEQGTGKYIGKFVGKLTSIGGEFHRYKGVFTNYKGGKVNFNLEEYSPE